MKKRYIPLRRRIEDAELSQTELAALAHIGISTLSKRLGGPAGEWRGYEIERICKIVGIPKSQIGELFFPDLKDEVSA